MKQGHALKRLCLVFFGSFFLMLTGCLGDASPQALLAKAQTALAKNDRKSAEIHLKNLLQTSPQHVEGRLLLARLHVSNRDERSAAKEWQRAIEAGADVEDALAQWLSSLYGSGNYSELSAAADRYPVRTERAQAQVLYWRGQALWQQRKPEQARLLFNDALAIQPDHHPSRLALIRMQGYQDPAAALVALEALLEQAPGMADALLLRAEYAIRQRDFLQAQTLLRRAIESQPEHLESRVRLIALLAERKDYTSAESEYQQLASIASQSALTRMMRVLLDYRQDHLQQAAEGIDQVLKGAPGYAPAFILGSQIALSRGEFESAEQRARRVIDLTEGSVAGYRLLTAIALARNEPDKALQIARSRIDLGHEDAGLLVLAGEAALRRNDLPVALDLLTRATKEDPADPSMRTALGLASLAAGNPAAGFTELERAIDLDAESSRADLALIGQRLQRGEWDVALKAIERLERKQPGKALTLNLRGAALMAQGNLTGARQSFEQALQRDGSFFPAVANLVRLDLNEAKTETGRRRLEAFVRSNPKDANALLALAQLQRTLGARAEEVTRLLRQAHEVAPAQLEPLIALANQLASQDKAREALPIVQMAVAQHPEDLRLLDLMGTLFLRSNDPQQALDVFTKIVRIKPERVSAHLRLGEVRSALGDQAGAIASFRQAAELDRGAPGAQFGLANALLKDGRKDEALRLARKLQQDQPQSSLGLILEGDLLAADKHWKEAAAAYRRGLQIERTAMAVQREQRALQELGETAQAEAALKRHLNAIPNDLTLRIYAGNRAIGASQWKVAAEHFQVVVRRTPNDAEARNNLAFALHMMKDPGAEAHARAAVQIAPLSGPIADTLGVILMAQGQPRQALDVLRQAVTLSPRDAQIRLHLLQALEQTAAVDETRRQVAQWLTDFPDSEHMDAVRAIQHKLARQ